MGVSKNNGTPKSSHLFIGFSIRLFSPSILGGKHPYFWFNVHMDPCGFFASAFFRLETSRRGAAFSPKNAQLMVMSCGLVFYGFLSSATSSLTKLFTQQNLQKIPWDFSSVYRCQNRKYNAAVSAVSSHASPGHCSSIRSDRLSSGHCSCSSLSHHS